jgi:putative endonuclease
MSFWVYILQSESTGKFYTGQTSDLQARIARHNSQYVDKERYTKKQKGPWNLIYSEKHENRSDAMKREKDLKSGQGRAWIKEQFFDKKLKG